MIDESSNGQAIELRLGEVAELRLGENPTTGFRWNVEASGEPACVLIDDFFEAAPAPPGSGGVHRWRLQARQAGRGRLELVSRRTWETSGPGAQTFGLDILVPG